MTKKPSPRNPAGRSKAATRSQAARTPESGPTRYRADTYHEIEVPGGGVKRVEPGDIVVTDGASIEVYPPALFEEAFPDIKVS